MDKSTNIEITQDFLYMLYKAENSLWYINSLIASKSSLAYAAIKFKNHEDVYVWLDSLVIEGEWYHGRLSETGENKRIKINEAVDWMIVENGQLLGGYTIQHYYDSLCADDKINFEIECGFRIDGGNDFFPPDRSTPEGTIITLENFYNEENIDGILSCKDFFKEAKNVLRESEIEENPEMINKIASVLKISFHEELESNGYPFFGDVKRTFKLLEKHNDQQLIEENIFFPDGTNVVNKFWLAKSGNDGWKVLNLIS